MRPRIYLAGPIGGLTWAEATSWRDEATVMLSGLECLSPLRDMDGMSLKASCFTEERELHPSLMKIPFKKLFERDYADVHTCDAVLFNFVGAKRSSYGTIAELAWTYRRNMPNAVVIDQGNMNNNVFGEMMYGFKTDSLERACNFLRNALGFESYSG